MARERRVTGRRAPIFKRKNQKEKVLSIVTAILLTLSGVSIRMGYIVTGIFAAWLGVSISFYLLHIHIKQTNLSSRTKRFIFPILIALSCTVALFCIKSYSSLNIEDRPFIQLVRAYPNGDLRKGVSSTITYTLRNTGKTVAVDVRCMIFLDKKDSLVWPSFNMDNQPKTSFGGETERDYTVYTPELSTKDIIDFQWGAVMFLYGHITYKDLDGHKHWSNVCLWYDFRNRVFREYSSKNDSDYSPDESETTMIKPVIGPLPVFFLRGSREEKLER